MKTNSISPMERVAKKIITRQTISKNLKKSEESFNQLSKAKQDKILLCAKFKDDDINLLHRLIYDFRRKK